MRCHSVITDFRDKPKSSSRNLLSHIYAHGHIVCRSCSRGRLRGYGPSLLGTFHQAMLGKVLQGARAADLPVVRPTKFERVVNLKTAKALGLTVPTALLRTR
jgi:hypothetical protein